MNRTTASILFAVLVTAAAGLSASPWQVLPCWGGGYVQNAVFCPSNPGRMYLYVDVGGPYRSDDAGASWRPLHTSMPVAMRQRGFDQVRSLSVDPRDADSVVVLAGADGDTPGGFAVTRDGGRTWSVKQDAFAYGNGPMRVEGFCLSRNPFNPNELVGGEDRSGIFVSHDNGDTWANTGPTGVWFTDIRHDAAVPGRFLCGGRDKPVQESTDGGRSWHDYRPLEGLSCGGIAFDGQVPGLVVFACRDGLYLSADGGASIQPLDGGLEVPSGRSRFIALDRGRLFFLTSGSGVWRRQLP